MLAVPGIFVNIFFHSLFNDPKCTNNNWYSLCFHFPHSGDFNLLFHFFKVNLQHHRRGNLMVSLVSAEGTTSKLATARQLDR